VAAHELKDILDRLAALGDISARAMFGAHGLYWRGVIFAIAHRERLYLKVNDQSRPAFEALGMGPFRPNDRQTLKSYYEVPQIVLNDTEALLSWAGEAIRAGQSSESPG
jgi:DNA transformation protein and related proteins